VIYDFHSKNIKTSNNDGTNNGFIAGIVVSSPAESLDTRLVFVVCYVRSGLCDELITRSEEFYRVCVCVIVCDLETSTMGCYTAEKKNNIFLN
jgi:hypothetical protein